MTDPSQSAREMVERPSGILKLAMQSGGKRFGPLTWNISFTEEAWDDFVQTLLAAQAAPGEPVAWQVRCMYDRGSVREDEWLEWRDCSEVHFRWHNSNSSPRMQTRALYATLAALPQDGHDPATIEALAADFENSVHHVWDKDEVANRIRSLASGGKVK